MEVLLVLALLVAVAALTLPVLSGPLDNHRLRKSADMVRVQWARARVQSMESGRTYVFRYQPNGNAFMVEPWSLDNDYLESDQITGLGPGAVGGVGAAAGAVAVQDTMTTSTATNFAANSLLGELPENVRFVASETAADQRDQYTAAAGQQNVAVDATWSPPIFFYPDGTASTARLIMTNSRQRFIMLTMRGLTGVVHVSDLMGFEELQL